MIRASLLLVILQPSCAVGLQVSPWDFPARWSKSVSQNSGKRVQVSVESRGRYERWRGRQRDLDMALFRHRLTLSYKPASWLKVSGAVRDSRAPGYGPNAPSSVRDSADLHEAYFELFPDRKRGLSLAAGRMALAYGETRLLATAQWGNVQRTFDTVRATWKTAKSRTDVLFASPVRARLEGFNRPVLSERLWGVYSMLSEVGGKHSIDLYALRREQNRTAGFLGDNSADGTDRLGVNTFGSRATGPALPGMRYGLEAAVQTGKIGADSHRAFAWASWLSRRWPLGSRSVELLGEYKYASGAKDPKAISMAGTFDSLYPSTHDKFGHMDLFGWRNIHYVKILGTVALTKSLALNAMSSSWWLASLRDSLYNASGRAIVRSAGGTAGRHVGEEADVFATYRFQHFLFGAGGGRMFPGEFLRNTRPAIPKTYLYVMHTYTF
ncbi:MAG: alginate export family protein [Bryobacteraceae bacterium]